MNIYWKNKLVVGTIIIILLGAVFLFTNMFLIRIPVNDKNVVFQNKENNCGPAALKMIFNHYKIISTLPEIEAEVKLSEMGTSMFALKKMAELKGFHAEGWRLTLNDFLKITFPAILFVNGDHFIVADSVLNDTLYYRDPTNGKCKLKTNSLLKIWNGETLVIKHI